MDTEASAMGAESPNADLTGGDDDYDAGDETADQGNDPEPTAERDPDISSDPDAQ
jgi:hypothetical protein